MKEQEEIVQREIVCVCVCVCGWGGGGGDDGERRGSQACDFNVLSTTELRER